MLYYAATHWSAVWLPGAPPVLDVAPERERALGADAYRQILADARVVSSGAFVDLVRDVGPRLATVVEGPPLDWEFTVIDSDEVNAFCLPGGKVVVYAGLAAATPTPDGLSVVLGHVIAHAVGGHGVARVAAQRLAGLPADATVADMDVQTRRLLMGAFGVGAHFGVLLPYAREHEVEADRAALAHVARACFDPTEAPRLWTRLEHAGTAIPPAFLSTHPSRPTRAADFERWMPEALAIRRARCTADASE